MTSLRERAFGALAWHGASRLAERALRLLAYAALARYLEPDAFGVVSAVAAVMAAVEALTFAALDQVVVCGRRSERPEFLHTVFWIGVGRGAAVTGVLFALAPAFESYFGVPGSRDLFAMLAPMPLVTALASPRAHLLVRELRFAAWSAVRLAATVVGLAASLAAAIRLADARALLLGQMATAVLTTSGSYIVAPYRPRLRWDRESWQEIRAFALEAAGTPILLAVVLQAPAIVVGRMAGVAELGVFAQIQNLMSVPAEFALNAVSVVAVPAYASLRTDPAKLASAWLTALRGVALLALPCATAAAWAGSELPRAIYGDAFAGAAGLASVLAAGGGIAALLAATGPVFWGVGAPRHDRTTQAVRAALLVGTGIWLTGRAGAPGMAAAIAASVAAAAVVATLLVRRVVPVTLPEILRTVAPSAVVSAAALGALLLVDATLQPTGWARVAAAGIAGVASAAILWLRHPPRLGV